MTWTSFVAKTSPRLEELFGAEQATMLLEELALLLRGTEISRRPVRPQRWDERDVILITYGNSLVRQGEAPLETLNRFLSEQVAGLVSTVHILPFFPYSSDDGFSVIDYTRVDPELGDWEDVQRLGRNFDLMMDLVINHVSRESLWFVDFLNAKEPGCYYFIEMDPNVDLSEVVRPRQSKVLTPVHTHRGLKHVWSTFSEDQIDVNFANPNVLLEYVRILLLYVRQGARFIRLDAIAYLWKKLGTGCINLPQTHQVVKLLRDVLALVAPHVVLLTETNLPHDQNISYFGDRDEAHMVYQFSLAPLLLHALYRGTSLYLNRWASSRCEVPEGCTFLNFTASHDGIGLRPAEGLIPPGEIEALVEAMQGFGGFVSMKANQDGSESPYEINIALFDAFKGTGNGLDQWRVARFLCSQTVMLALKGIPAVYIHGLTACPNDIAGVQRTGRTRSINRKNWEYGELTTLLESPFTPNAMVFNELRRLLAIRKEQSAFHPDAGQQVYELGEAFFALERVATHGRQRLVAISNLTAELQFLDMNKLFVNVQGGWRELIGGDTLDGGSELVFQPYQSVWLSQEPGEA